MFRRLLAIALIAFGAAPGSAAGLPASLPGEALPCAPAAGEEIAGRVECRALPIRLDWTRPGPPDATMAYAVIRPAGPVDPALPPLLFIMGGNGAGLPLMKRAPTTLAAIMGPRPLILVDARGVHLSRPAPVCSGFKDGGDALAAEPEAVSACAAEIRKQGLNLNLFRTAGIAHDIAQLRRTLGVSQWDVYGVSYGTQIAQRLMAIDAEGVRRLVLDGVIAPDIGSRAERALATPFLDLIDQCRADKACHTAYPELEFELAAAVAKAPDPAAFLSKLKRLMNQPDTRGAVPRIVAAAAGDLTPWRETKGRGQMDPTEAEPSLASWTSVCTDDWLLPRDASDAPARRPLPPAVLQAAASDPDWNPERFCAALPYQPTTAAERATARVKSPALFLVGMIDQLTAPWEAERLAKLWPQTQLVRFPNTGHWVLRKAPECAAAITRAFFEKPDRPVDDACARAIPDTRFQAQ